MKRRATHTVLAVLILLAGTGWVTGQDTYKLSPKEMHAFKLAKQYHYNGTLSYKKKKFERAEKDFKKCLEKFPEYSSAYYYLAKISYNRGNLNEAMTMITDAKKHYKYMSDLLNDTQLEYLKTLRRQRENLMADLNNSMLNLSTSERGEMEKKVQNIDNILKKPLPEPVKMPADYYFVQGNIFFKMKKIKEAHDLYVDAIKTDPTHTETYNNLISLYYTFKKFDLAYQYTQKAMANEVKLNPKLKAAVLKAVKAK